MVSRILKMFHQEVSGMHQAALLLGFFTLLSQILALVRDRLLAHYFGAGHVLDIYYAAFRVPDLIYALIASLVSISVLIPFFSGIFERRKEEAAHLMDTIFTGFMLLMIAVSAVAWLLMPHLVDLILPGIKDPAAQKELISLSRILLLQPICLGISNLLGVITQISKRFVIYALSPIFYNIAIIFGLFVLYPRFGLKGIVMGVVLGGILHFLIQIPYVKSRNLVPWFTLNIDKETIKEIFYLSVPRTLTLSASQIELIFITSYASLLASGSIAIFNLSNNLQSVPFAIIGVSYTLAAFPTLSGYFAKGERDKFINQVTIAARHIIFWSIPITVFFIVLRAQIVRTILGSGYFNWDNTRLTAACLALFVVSLAAQGLELLFIRAYYAAGRTKKPLVINLLSSVITITMPYLFLYIFNHCDIFRYFIGALFKVDDIAGSAVLMLPLGYSIGTLINALIFWIMFEKDFGTFSKKVCPSLFTSLQAAIIGGFIAYVGLTYAGQFLNLNTLQGIFFQGAIGGLLGIGASIIVFILLKNEEIKEVWGALNQKFKLKLNRVVVSDPEDIEM